VLATLVYWYAIHSQSSYRNIALRRANVVEVFVTIGLAEG
jgi:hypothetical protein